MVMIITHTQFHARAMKEPDIDKGTLGYNFSYPILNTIEIGNLFITGGSVSIQIERIGETIWSFDKIKSDLHIKKNGQEEIYHIDNIKELYKEMSKHFQDNYNQLISHNMSTNKRKTVSQKGNQNAVKKMPKSSQNIETTNNNCNQGNDEPPKDFIRYSDYRGSDVSYCILAKQKGWLEYVSYEILYAGWVAQVLKPEDIPDKIKKEHPYDFRGIYQHPEIKVCPRGAD